VFVREGRSDIKAARSENARLGWFLTNALLRWAPYKGGNFLLVRRTMSAADTLQITEKLPPELLEKILTDASVPDIIKLKQVGKQPDCIQRSQLNFEYPLLFQVNRGFRDFVQDSPYIKFRIDLFAAGLEDNPSTNLTLSDRRKAFDEYRTKWETFKPTMKREQQIGSIFDPSNRAKALGVFAFIGDPKEFVEFLPWSRSHEGYHGKSGSSHCPTSRARVSRSTLAQTYRLLSFRRKQGNSLMLKNHISS
jgi:hypothetical protein